MQNLFLCVLQVQCILLKRTFPTGVVNVRIYNNIFRIGNSRDFSLITVCASGIKYLALNIFSNKVVPLKVRKKLGLSRRITAILYRIKMVTMTCVTITLYNVKASRYGFLWFD